MLLKSTAIQNPSVNNRRVNFKNEFPDKVIFLSFTFFLTDDLCRKPMQERIS